MFLINSIQTTWKFVRNWSRRTLEKASEQIVDVQGEDDDFEEDDEPVPKEENSTAKSTGTEAPETASQRNS